MSERRLPHDRGAGEIEPNDRVGTLPDQITHRRIVAVHDPAVARDGIGDPLPELVGRQRRPVGLVKDRVELHMGYLEPARQCSRKRRLAGTGVADDRYATHDRRQ
jgi:hypothetical protein